MDLVSSTRYLERARMALSLAGRALDPNGKIPAPDVTLGADLLCRALENTLRAMDPERDPRGALSEAVADLGDDLLIAAAGNRARALAVTSGLVAAAGGGVGATSAVAQGERFVAELIASTCHEGRARRRWDRVLLSTFVLLVLLAGGYAVAPSAEDDLRFRASSASNGYRSMGRIGNRGRHGVFLHTRQQIDPWVEIDLGRERDLSEVRIVNRSDCCGERALPLVVSLRTQTGLLHEVSRRNEAFDSWEATFPTESARYVRLSVPRETILHLQEVHFR